MYLFKCLQLRKLRRKSHLSKKVYSIHPKNHILLQPASYMTKTTGLKKGKANHEEYGNTIKGTWVQKTFRLFLAFVPVQIALLVIAEKILLIIH
jgi:hypothetical protein